MTYVHIHTYTDSYVTNLYSSIVSHWQGGTVRPTYRRFYNFLKTLKDIWKISKTVSGEALAKEKDLCLSRFLKVASRFNISFKNFTLFYVPKGG